jgi:hypothetical protein
MEIYIFFFFWFCGHQILLIFLTALHLIYNRDNMSIVFAVSFAGFFVHSLLFSSWFAISKIRNTCGLIFAITTGSLGWSTSLLLILSFHHWIMPFFLVASIIWPFFILCGFSGLGITKNPQCAKRVRDYIGDECPRTPLIAGERDYMLWSIIEKIVSGLKEIKSVFKNKTQ